MVDHGCLRDRCASPMENAAQRQRWTILTVYILPKSYRNLFGAPTKFAYIYIQTTVTFDIKKTVYMGDQSITVTHHLNRK